MNLQYITESILNDIIFPYISLNDLFELGRTCKHLTCALFYVNDIIIDRINARLLSHFNNDKSLANEFKQLLKSTCSVISGSILIQCALNIGWKYSDLDIYIPTIGNEVRELIHTLKDGTQSTGYPKTILDDFIYNKAKIDGGGTGRGYSGMTKDYIELVNDYDRIEIVGVKVNKSVSEIKRFIDQTFDLDICKNMYYIDQDGIEHVKFNTLRNIMNMECNLVIDTRMFAKYSGPIISRCNKYEERGYTILNLEEKKRDIVKTMIQYPEYIDNSDMLGANHDSTDSGMRDYIFLAKYEGNNVIIHPRDKERYLNFDKSNAEIICNSDRRRIGNGCHDYSNCIFDSIDRNLIHYHKPLVINETSTHKSYIFIIIY